MNTLLVPCWQRGEFLWHCLDNLHKTGDLHRVHVIFKPDTGHSQEVMQVIDEWTPKLQSWEVVSAIPARNRATKQSLNVLSGYLYAAKQSDGLVFMVEEDVMVGRDFFRFHEALHGQERLFASLSVLNVNRPAKTQDAPDAYYLSHGDYCSLGVCMRREVILDHISPHVNDAYLTNPVEYCAAHWPKSAIGRAFAEQDGLIRRIQEASDLPTAYPHNPRAFHAGFYGYNRQRIPKGGTLKDKKDRVASIIYDRDKMRRSSHRPEHYADSIPQPLELPAWDKLRHIEA